MKNAAVLFNNLQGLWTLERTIAGHARMDGQALFTPQSQNRLYYREDIKVILETGVVCDGFQDYLYILNDKRISAHFKDERPFHDLIFHDDTTATAEHLCGQDLYKARYAFENESLFHLEWQVKGPRKDYVSRSIFRRAPTPAPKN